MILDLFQKSETYHFNILSISWDSFGFLELGVVLNLTLVFPLKEKSSQKIALNVALVVVLVYLAFLTGSLPVKNWKITEINLYLF